MNINEFKTALSQGGARANLFEVTISTPPVGSLSNFKFLCKTTTIPTSVIAPISIPFMGRDIKMAGDRTFDTWSTTIINDEDFAVHGALTNWMNGINNHSNNVRTLDGTDYQVDAQVTHYKKEGDVAKEITIINAWPASVAAIELGWDTNDAIEEFTVTWQYDYWQAEGQTS